MKNYFINGVLFLALLLTACGRQYRLTEHNYYGYQVYKGLHASETAEQMITPYRDSLSSIMNEVIGISDTLLLKEQPEGTLGNFCADAYREIAASYTAKPVDVCFMNNGGFRVPSLPKGNITVGHIYELMPFDNNLVVIEISGKDMIRICNRIAQRGGWPVSGLRMKISGYKASEISIGGLPVDSTGTYTIATSDYLANGGDELELLKAYPQQKSTLLLRQALIDYIRMLTSNQKHITSIKDQRIINEP